MECYRDDSADEAGDEAEPLQAGEVEDGEVSRAGAAAGRAMLAAIGTTGLPKEFAGDVVDKVETTVAAAMNNNVEEVVVDRWATRFKASYPGLQRVIKLSKEQREYLDSLSYDDLSETPTGDGRSTREDVVPIEVPNVRFAVEGPPVT